jgi:O-antigen/teichoic acid export membrane protein
MPHLPRLLRSTAWTLLGALAARGSAYVGLLLAARVLGKEDFGRLGAVQNSVGLVATFVGFGLGLTATTWVSRLRASDPGRAGRVAGATVMVALLGGGLGALVLAALAGVIAVDGFLDVRLTLPLRLGAALVPLGVLAGVQVGLMAGCEAFPRLAAANAVSGLAGLPLPFLGALVGGVGGAVVGLVAAQAAQCLAVGVALRRAFATASLRLTCARWWGEWRLLLSFSLPTALASSLVIPVNWYGAQWLARLGGMDELGLFNAGNQYRMAVLLVPMQLVSASLPALAALRAGGDRAGYRRTLALALALAGATAGVAALVVGWGAGPLLALFGRDFAAGTAALVVLGACALPMALNNVLGAAINASGRAWRSAAATGVYALTALALLAVVPHDAAGLAWSQLGGSVAALLAYAVLVATLPPPRAGVRP